MLTQIKVPNCYLGKLYSKYKLFMAGSITGAWDWQSYLYNLLSKFDMDITVLNPRRDKWDMNAGPDLSRAQIRWEYDALWASDAISFYFSHETVAPITMYELGVHTSQYYTDYEDGPIIYYKKIFVCVHPDYPRRFDVEEQLSLSRPDIEIVYSLEDLAGQIMEWYNNAI